MGKTTDKYFQFMVVTARENQWDSGLTTVCVLANNFSEAKRKAKVVNEYEIKGFKAFLRKYNHVKVHLLMSHEHKLPKGQLLYLWHLVALSTYQKERLDDEKITATLICSEVIDRLYEIRK